MVSSATFCGGVLPLSVEQLVRIQAWERGYLRIALPMRHTEDKTSSPEGHAFYLERTGRQIDALMEVLGYLSMVHEFL